MTERKDQGHQPSRLSPRARLLLATAALLVLLPFLGCMASGAYITARKAAVFTRWRSLGAPPGTAVDIVTADLNVVYLRTAAGDIYVREHRGTRTPDDRWRQAQEPLSVDHRARFDTRLYQGDIKPPPGTIVDTLTVTVWRGEDAFETRYVLLQDGTVWKWEYDVGAYWHLLILLLGPAVGGALAIIAVILLWARAGLRSRRRRED